MNGHDLRLAWAAVVAWLAVLWGLSQSSRHVALAAGVAPLAASVTTLAARRWRAMLAVAFALFAVTVVLAPLAARLHRAHDGELSALAAARVELTAELVVTGDPRPLVARGPGGSARMVLDARVIAVSIAGHRTEVAADVLVLGPADGWRAILPGQRVRLDARLAPPLPDNLLTATLSARTDPELLGAPPWWQRAAGAVRAGLQRASAGLPSLPRGLLPGLVDGDTSQLDPVLAERFRVAGLTHLVAVSGTNLAIVIGAVGLLLKRARASPRTIALIGGVVLVGFVVLARPSPSVLRAAGMAAIALVALACGRQRSAAPVLAAAVIGLLLWKPTLASDLGFVLSASATAALILLAPRWVIALRRRRVPVGIAEALAVASAAHVVTAPIIVGLSGRISLVAIPANLLAEPVVAAATVLGLLAALTSVLWLPVACVLTQLAGWPCRWLVWVAEYFGSLPGASVPWPSGVAGGALLSVVTLVLLVSLRYAAPRALLGVALCCALVVQIPVRSVVTAWPPTGWLVVACDVGQGDALALSNGSGTAVVVDAGPDPVAVDRCLHELGVQRVPLLVLTHNHLDHVGGLSGVFHDRVVTRVVTSPLAEPVSGNRLVSDVLARHGLRPEALSAGVRFDLGRVQLQVLGPGHRFTGTRSDPNNSSVVLLATVGDRRVLLSGDAEIEGQDALLASGADLRADILKVPHHGSAYSDPAFLRAVHAQLALVSVGQGNDYGHPSPLLIAELARLGVAVQRTDQSGDIAVVLDQGRLVPVVHRARAGNARAPPSEPRATMSDVSPASEIAPLTLVVGDEEFLIARALEDIRKAVLDADPDGEVYECEANSVDAVELMQLLSPSLFGGRRLIVLRSAQDLTAALAQTIVPMLLDADPETTIVFQHLAGAKGKAILETVRKAKPAEITCARITRAEDRQQFLRAELRRFNGRITPDAAAALLDAVGSDLREISAVLAQLIGDTGGSIDAAAVAAYHRGRAEVTGFAVADQAVVGNTGAALTNLRWALNIGVAPVLIADALADGVRTVARVMGAGPGDPFRLAPILGMPPWKVKRARSQSQGWSEAGLQRALGIVASLNADVKGAAADPAYALESAIRRVAAARSSHR